MTHVLGVPAGDDFAASVAAFGTHVDEVIGRLNDVQVVLNDENGVALVNEPMEHSQKFANILKMQTRRGLIENVNRVAGRALVFTASLSQCAGPHRQTEPSPGCPHTYIAQPNFLQRLQLSSVRSLGSA